MTFWEAVEAARAGKKVKRVNTNHVFVWGDNGLQYETDSGQIACVNQLNLGATWQIVEGNAPRYTFLEAVVLMKQGKRMRDNTGAVFKINDGVLSTVSGGYTVLTVPMVDGFWTEDCS